MASFYESARTQMTGSDGAADSFSSSPPSSKTSPFVLVVTLVLLPCLIAYKMVTGNESQVIAIALAAIGGLLIIARPFWGLIFFVGLLYTRPEESIAALQGTRLPLIVSSVTLLAMCFQKMLNREALVKTPLNGMILGFGAAAIASAVVAQGDVTTAAMDIARLVILVFLVLNLVTTAKLYKTFATTLIVFTIYLAGYSIYLYLTGAALVEHGVLRSQATGIFSDPNDIAGTIIAGFGMMLFRIRSEKKIARLVYVALSAFSVWAILLTQSRGGRLALAGVLVYFILVSTRKKAMALVIIVLTLVPLLLVGGGRSTNFDSSDASANSRFWFWTTGVEQLIQHPLLGIGYNGYFGINGGMTAHNSFILCATETGFIGYFFWMGSLYYCFRRFSFSEDEGGAINQAGKGVNADLRRVPHSENSIQTKNTQSWELLGARVGLAGFLMSAFWISRAYVPVLYLFIALPVVQQVSAQPYVQKFVLSSDERNKDWGRIALLCLGSIVFIYFYALRNR